MSTAQRQRLAAEPAGPQRSPAAEADGPLALGGGSAVPAWSDSPRQLKQAAQLTQLQAAAAPAAPAQSGLPDGLGSGIEALSGIAMSGVRVHRNSSKPAALQAQPSSPITAQLVRRTDGARGRGRGSARGGGARRGRGRQLSPSNDSSESSDSSSSSDQSDLEMSSDSTSQSRSEFDRASQRRREQTRRSQAARSTREEERRRVPPPRQQERSGDAQEQAPDLNGLTPEELAAIDTAPTWRWLGRGDQRMPLYGDDSERFLGFACWNWALSGGQEDAVNPYYLFELLGDLLHGSDATAVCAAFSFDEAWEHFVGEGAGSDTYAEHRSAIQVLWNRRRALNARRARRRTREQSNASQDSIERITADAMRLAMRMNQLEPDDDSRELNPPLAIVMAGHPDHGVNWSHWGLEINGHSFETIPGWGLWHQQEGFEFWANSDSIEDTQITRVPLRSMTARHVEGVRGQLSVMRRGQSNGRGNSSRGRGQRRSEDASRASREPVQVQGPPQIAPAANVGTNQMVTHYFEAIAWANQQGTYSAEFHFVRDHPNQARQVLQTGGMDDGAITAFLSQFQEAVTDQQQGHAGYVEAAIQEQIMQTLGPGEQLFAIIRYLRSQAL